MKIEAFPNIKPLSFKVCPELFELLCYRYIDKDDFKINKSINVILDEKEQIYFQGFIDSIGTYCTPVDSEVLVKSMKDIINALKEYKSIILTITNE